MEREHVRAVLGDLPGHGRRARRVAGGLHRGRDHVGGHERLRGAGRLRDGQDVRPQVEVPGHDLHRGSMLTILPDGAGERVGRGGDFGAAGGGQHGDGEGRGSHGLSPIGAGSPLALPTGLHGWNVTGTGFAPGGSSQGAESACLGGMPKRSLAVALLLFSGCSWMAMARPPPTPVAPAPPVACTTSGPAPALDTAGTLLGVPGRDHGLRNRDSGVHDGLVLVRADHRGNKAAIISVGLVLVGISVMQTVSAVNGYGWAADCEALQGQQLACLSGVETSCAVLRTPPPRPGRSPGEPCAADDECSQGNICHLGRCQRGGP